MIDPQNPGTNSDHIVVEVTKTVEHRRPVRQRLAAEYPGRGRGYDLLMDRSRVRRPALLSHVGRRSRARLPGSTGRDVAAARRAGDRAADGDESEWAILGSNQ